MKVALILTGHINGFEQSFPHYLNQIQHSTVITQADIFASVHSDTGQSLQDLSSISSHFAHGRNFIESSYQQGLPCMMSRGHRSIAEFAAAVEHWRDLLKDYDIVWRGRWDSYLSGDSRTLDAQLKDCWHMGGHSVKVDPLRHRVLTRSLVVNYGRPAMEGKHYWATAHTVIAAFDNWETRWQRWLARIGDYRFDAHLTWAEIYASIGANIANGSYSVEKVFEDIVEDVVTKQVHRNIKMDPDVVSTYPAHTVPKEAAKKRNRSAKSIELLSQQKTDNRRRISGLRENRRAVLTEKIRSQNPR
jgi:hypothetical protein